MTAILREIYTIFDEIVIDIMNTLTLPLLSTVETIPTAINIPIAQKEELPIMKHSQDLFDPLKNAFRETFLQTPEENTVIKMRRALGENAKFMPDEQVQCIATEFQFLIENWLDEFEKDVFNGMTLKEVLNEK